MRTRIEKYIVLLIILLLGIIYHYRYINEFPSHIHAWAQSDRYALSFGFLDNGLNFFKPQTYIYNHQFPHGWEVPSQQTITAVDFPIHDYVPALLMKLTGNTSPWLFRIYILFYSLVGLFFLLRLAYAVTNDYLRSILVVVFAATSPVYVYYQGGFLPTIPSLSNAMIGIYFYYRHFTENRDRDFSLSILFLTLAALSRTTFAIPLTAVLCVEFIRIVKRETRLVAKIIPVSISMLLILSYWFYNGYLRASYGSDFLNLIVPPDSISHAKEIISIVYVNWFFQYFTPFHYSILVAVLLLAVIIMIRSTSKRKLKGYLGLLTITYFIGCMFFAILMLQQYPAHDYYFLDTFFLPVIMSLLFFLTFIPAPESRNLKTASIIGVFFISILLILQPVKSQEKRRETAAWDKTAATIENYTNSSAFLDSLGIPTTAKVLVIDAVAPNLPFTLMKRKGFTVMNTNREKITNALKWKYDYIVLQNDYFISDICTSFPGILSKLNKLADNGKISVCTLSDHNNQTLLDFFDLNKKRPAYEKLVTFENKPDSLWYNYNPSDKVAFSDSFSGHLTPGTEYGLTFKSRDIPVLTTSPRKLLVSSWFLADTTVNCQIVTSINTNGQSIYYKTYNLRDFIRQHNQWEKVNLIFQLPKIQNDNYELRIFLWNPGKDELYYDDFAFFVY